MTSQNVLSLQSKKQALQELRIAQILAVLETARTFPTNLGEEVPTGDLVATRDNWAYFERVFEAFQLELPRDVNAQAAIGSVVYLAGHLGSKIKLRATNESVYQRVKSTLTPPEREYVESLFGQDTRRPGVLIQQLGVLQKLPNDFA